MAGFTDYGSHGVLDTPRGTVVLRPDQYAAFGVQEPSVPLPVPTFGGDSPVPPEALGLPIPPPGPGPGDPVPQAAFDALDPALNVSRPDVPPPQPQPAGAPPAPTATPAPDAPAPAPMAQQSTPAPNLSAATYGDVLAAQKDAIDQSTAADAAAVQAQAGINDERAAALAARNAAVEAEQAKFAAEEQRQQQAIAETTQRYGDAVKQFADAKVDRANYRVSPLQAIGVALAGIGSAYKGQGDKNPALDLLMRQIDQYVEDEYRKKDSLGQNAGMVKDQLGVLQGQATSLAARKQLAVSGILEKSIRDMEAMAPRMENKLNASRVLQLAAAGREKLAGLLGNAVQLQHGEDQQRLAREQQERESRRQAAAAAARLREDQRQFNLDYDLRLRKAEEERAAAIASAQTAQEKDIAEHGVPDLQMKAADGSTVMYQAREGSHGNPGMVAQDVTEKFAAVKTLDELVAEGIRLRDSFKGDFGKLKKSPEWQKYTANITAAGVAWSKLNKMGTWDAGTERAVLGAEGGDPNRDGYLADLMEGLLTGKAQVGLEQFRKNAAASFNTYAETMRRPGSKYIPWEPPPVHLGTDAVKRVTDENVDAILGDSTPQEIRDRAAPNKLERGLGYVASALDTPGERQRTNAEGLADIEAGRKQDRSGLVTQAQAGKIDALAAQAATGDGDKAEAARAALEGLALKTERPELQQRALDKLADIGDEATLQRVEAALVSQQSTERGQEAVRRDMDIVRKAAADRVAANDPAAAAARAQTPPVDALADLVLKGDANAGGMLMAIATGRPANQYAKKPTTKEQLAAQDAIRAIQRKRGGK